MHVLIDARKINDGGIGTYIRNLVQGLVAIDGVKVGLICAPNSKLPLECEDRVMKHIDPTPLYSLREAFRFPNKAVLRQYDVLHIPHFTLPFGISIPTVITVHDLIHVTHPEHWYYPKIAGAMLRSALGRATRVLTVSQATARLIGDLVHRDRTVIEKLRVVPNAIDPNLLGTGAIRPSDRGPEGSYLLSICSTFKPHKGIRELLEAFSLLKRAPISKRHPTLKLVIAGQGVELIKTGRVQLPHHEDVHFVGAVSPQELSKLYAGAAALVVASRAEGFCLPVLEAQAYGVPVVTTPIPAIEDLVTNQDTVASDFSPSAISAAIAEALDKRGNGIDAEVKAEYARHLARFNRDLLSRDVFTVYEEALGGDLK